MIFLNQLKRKYAIKIDDGGLSVFLRSILELSPYSGKVLTCETPRGQGVFQDLGSNLGDSRQFHDSHTLRANAFCKVKRFCLSSLRGSSSRNCTNSLRRSFITHSLIFPSPAMFAEVMSGRLGSTD